MSRIPILDLNREYAHMQGAIDKSIQKCLKHQQWILGPEVAEFEKKFSEYLSVKHCIGVSSGTDALVIALRALAIKIKGKEYFTREDKIITTPFTFTATGDAILRAGATPVFVDIDPQTFNIDPNQIEEALTPDVVGIIPVHLYGQACAMDRICAIGKKHNLFVLEDVAQACGGEWKNRKLGTLADMGAFSFFPSKNLGCFGDGGMISTHDDRLAELSRMLMKHGGKDKYNVDHIGYNARLDTLQAAVLLAKLKYLDKFNMRRKKIAAIYSKELEGISSILLPNAASESHVFHQYTIRVSDGKRDQLQTRLKESGIGSMVYYPVPLHKMAVFKDRSVVGKSLTYAEKAAQEVLSLPIEPLLAKPEIVYVCRKLIRVSV